jgi:hypothetical protein
MGFAFRGGCDSSGSPLPHKLNIIMKTKDTRKEKKKPALKTAKEKKLAKSEKKNR